ncbi:MAG: hypothetical protein JSC189_000037 [Candidatus Tokpelaia sp. JSC189]|nr:MAG: hypothetical protein JSC189_000037 [Candidatus Tokpelaia sp. JSC189]
MINFFHITELPDHSFDCIENSVFINAFHCFYFSGILKESIIFLSQRSEVDAEINFGQSRLFQSFTSNAKTACSRQNQPLQRSKACAFSRKTTLETGDCVIDSQNFPVSCTDVAAFAIMLI